jgi:hypothetical protein
MDMEASLGGYHDHDHDGSVSDDGSLGGGADYDSSIVYNFMNRVVLAEGAAAQTPTITRLPDRNCARGDLQKLLGVLQRKMLGLSKERRGVALLVLDGAVLHDSPEALLSMTKQLAPFCGPDTRFIFLHPNEAVLAAAKRSLQLTLASVLPASDLEVTSMYWLRQEAAAPPPQASSFGSLSNQVMPFLVAAPSTAPLDCSPSASRGHATSLSCAAFIEGAPILKDTPAADRLLSLGASPYGVSPLFVSTMVRRLCGPRGGGNRGLVVAPLDRYGIISAGAALARRDCLSLCVAGPAEASGDYETTSAYIRQFLSQHNVPVIIEHDTPGAAPPRYPGVSGAPVHL